MELSHRESFSPDAAFYIGPRAGGKFLEGAPVFAAEVRSDCVYGAKVRRRNNSRRLGVTVPRAIHEFAAQTGVLPYK